MFKRSISLLCSFLIITLVFPFSAFAEGHTHTFGDNKRGLDMNSLPEGYSVPVTFYETPCTSGCGYSQYSWTFCGASGYYVDKSGLDALTVYIRLFILMRGILPSLHMNVHGICVLPTARN